MSSWFSEQNIVIQILYMLLVCCIVIILFITGAYMLRDLFDWNCDGWAEENHCDALCGTGVEQAKVIYIEDWHGQYICECPDGRYLFARKTCM